METSKEVLITKEVYQNRVHHFMDKELGKLILKPGWYPKDSLETLPLPLLETKLDLTTFPKIILNIFGTWHGRLIDANTRLYRKTFIFLAEKRLQRIVGQTYKDTLIYSIFSDTEYPYSDTIELFVSGTKDGKRSIIQLSFYKLFFRSPELWDLLSDCEGADLFLMGTKSPASSISRFIEHTLHEKECFRFILSYLIDVEQKMLCEKVNGTIYRRVI